MNKSTCIFCRIAAGEMQTEFLYEDDVVVAFVDIHPKKPVHVLIVPKNHVPHILALTDDTVLAHVRLALQSLATSTGLSEKGFKVEINGGGLQDVDHLHVHLTGPYQEYKI